MKIYWNGQSKNIIGTRVKELRKAQGISQKPGASGGAEYSFYTFFSPFCADRGVINLIMLLWRMITFYLPIGAGLVYFTSALRKIRQKEKTEQ